MVRQICHLHSGLFLTGIAGQKTCKEQLVVIAVGAQQQNVGLALQRRLPDLNMIGDSACGVSLDLAESHSALIKVEGHSADRTVEGILQVDILMQKAFLTGSKGGDLPSL